MVKSEILERVKAKTEKIVADSKFFQMQDELLMKVEKRNQSPVKQAENPEVFSPLSQIEPGVENCVQDFTQHKLRNRSVAKRDVVKEQKEKCIAKKQLKEKQRQ